MAPKLHMHPGIFKFNVTYQLCNNAYKLVVNLDVLKAFSVITARCEYLQINFHAIKKFDNGYSNCILTIKHSNLL